MLVKNVEDVYQLSPLQEVMLLHASSESGVDVLYNQVSVELVGELDIDSFKQAWQAVLDSHTALRTGFLWQGLNKPQQVVKSQLDLPWDYLDWQERDEQEQRAAFRQFCEDDRRQGFDVSSGPLIRVVLIHRGPQLYWMVWATHHLVVDRWCIQTLFGDFCTYYRALASGVTPQITRAPPYKRYIQWIRRQESHKAREYWREQLAGFSGTTASLVEKLSWRQSGTGSETQEGCFSGQDLVRLRDFARRNRLTLAELVQAAWSLVLNQNLGAQDIVFGIAVSGRPADLLDVEDMVGSFVSNLPVRVRLPADQRLGEWFASLRIATIGRTPFEYVAPGQIHRWCGLAETATLFDSLLVWMADTKPQMPEGLTSKLAAADLGSAYPLTLAIEDGRDALKFLLQLGSGYRCRFELGTLLVQLCEALGRLGRADEDLPLGQLHGFRVDTESCSLSTDSEPVPPSTLTDEVGEVSVPAASGREALEEDVIREYLTLAWQQILEIDSAPEDVSFFLLGGDSLKATALLDIIERVSRRSIPLMALFEHPTLGGMIQTVRQSDWPLAGELLIPLRTSGCEPPLFCLASPEVNTIGYGILAQHLGKERPLYVIQAPPFVDEVRQRRASELVSLAKTYLAAMQRVQRTGPYYLLGMCDGSQLAAEVCRLVESQNQRIAFFGVLNTWAYYSVSRLYHWQKVVNRGHYYRRRLSELLSLKGKSRLQALTGILRKKFKPSQQLAVTPQVGAVSAGDEADGQAPGEYSIIDDVGWASKLPDLQQISATVTVFRLRRQPYWRISDPSLGWSRLARNTCTVYLPGEQHLDILREPYVRSVATQLERQIKTIHGESDK